MCLDDSITIRVIESYGRISKHIEGHLHSDEYIGSKATPKMLLNEIEEYEKVVRDLKKLKKKKRDDNPR